jgi:hypothetical protein
MLQVTLATQEIPFVLHVVKNVSHPESVIVPVGASVHFLALQE